MGGSQGQKPLGTARRGSRVDPAEAKRQEAHRKSERVLADARAASTAADKALHHANERHAAAKSREREVRKDLTEAQDQVESTRRDFDKAKKVSEQAVRSLRVRSEIGNVLVRIGTDPKALTTGMRYSLNLHRG